VLPAYDLGCGIVDFEHFGSLADGVIVNEDLFDKFLLFLV